MLTAERIEFFKQLIANNQIPTNTEDNADFEIVKAMVISQASAGQVAQPAAVPATVPVAQPAAALTPAAPVRTTAVDTPVPSNGSSFTMEDAMKSAMAVDH